MSAWNEFQYVGYAITNWERKVTPSGFAYRTIKIEVSGGKVTQTFVVKGYERDTKIDYEKEIKGKLILICGYNKAREDTSHPEYDPVIWQIAETMLIMERGMKDNAKPKSNNSYKATNIKSVDIVESEPEPEPEEYYSNDEDLPF